MGKYIFSPLSVLRDNLRIVFHILEQICIFFLVVLFPKILNCHTKVKFTVFEIIYISKIT